MTEDFDIREERFSQGEKDFENALRPLSFSDFSGQKKVVENLEVFVEAAKYRGEPLDHTLLHGPPGLGKTTLSNIIANELGVGFKITSGPVLDKPGDLAGILTSLEKNDVLFIDEIHRLSPVVEEYLYSAMEDYRIDIMIDKGPSARSIQIAGLQLWVLLNHNIQSAHHLSQQISLGIDAGRSSCRCVTTASLDSLDDSLTLMLSILRSSLCQSYHRIETRIKLNLNLAQGIFAHFIETYQAALG